MSLRPSFALVGSLTLLFVACGGGTETVGSNGTGGSSTATGGNDSEGTGGKNLAGDTGAGGSPSEGTGGEGATRVCKPYETGVCIGSGACIGGRECSADGTRWSKCDCGDGTGGAEATGGASSGGASTGGTGTGGDIDLTGGTSSGGAATGGSETGGASTGGAATGGAATGGSATGGAGTGGAATGGVSSGGTASGGAPATGGTGSGGDGTGGEDPGISVGGSTCVGRPSLAQWNASSTQATGDQVRYKCTAAQAGCAGLPTGVDHLFECNQMHVLNCKNQTPESGNSWTFVVDCAPYRDDFVNCSMADPYAYGTDENFVTSLCEGGTPCNGATTGLLYMFECVDPYRPNCGDTNPGSNNWAETPWQRVGRCE